MCPGELGVSIPSVLTAVSPPSGVASERCCLRASRITVTRNVVGVVSMNMDIANERLTDSATPGHFRLKTHRWQYLSKSKLGLLHSKYIYRELACSRSIEEKNVEREVEVAVIDWL
jgi:hypothetical protein